MARLTNRKTLAGETQVIEVVTDVYPCVGQSQQRLRLPAGDVFGRNYRCCHTDRSAFWRVSVFDLAENRQLFSLRHPTCCGRGWAVATLCLAVRSQLRNCGLDTKSARACWSEIIQPELFAVFPVPQLEHYWELIQELRAERESKRLDRTAVRERREAAERFASRRSTRAQSANHAMPDCFRTLGFDQWPTVDELEEAYRAAALAHHPDRGGNKTDFQRINRAFEQARKSLKSRHRRP